jgi:2-polyprenyl-3-methyl-5-hydroxy-6-metoxy-1,4-benzoquinol methylase
MKSCEYDTQAGREKYHWWFQGRRHILDDILRSVTDDSGPSRTIYDIGCGVGNNCDVLASYGRVVGVDVNPQSFEYCSKRNYADLVLCSAEKLEGIPDGAADIVIAMDVLEHLDDDRAALAEFLRILKPSGHLILTVPAFPSLWGLQDELSQHRRRYRMRPLTRLVKEAGFFLLRKAYFNFFLFPPIFLVRAILRLFRLNPWIEKDVDDASILNALFKVIFRIEIFFLKWISYPYGASILLVCVKDRPQGGEKGNRRFDEFRLWNERMFKKYDLDRFHHHPNLFIRWVETLRARAIVRFLAPSPADRILEVGCGAGNLLERLSSGRLVGIDLSETGVKRTHERLGTRAGVALAAAEALPFGAASFDKVCCSEVLEHVLDPEAVLAEAHRVTRPGGMIVVSTPNDSLIDFLKDWLRKLHLYKLALGKAEREIGFAGEEWHLRKISKAELCRMLKREGRIQRIRSIPWFGLPLRYVTQLIVQ